VLEVTFKIGVEGEEYVSAILEDHVVVSPRLRSAVVFVSAGSFNFWLAITVA